MTFNEFFYRKRVAALGYIWAICVFLCALLCIRYGDLVVYIRCRVDDKSVHLRCFDVI